MDFLLKNFHIICLPLIIIIDVIIVIVPIEYNAQNLYGLIKINGKKKKDKAIRKKPVIIIKIPI